MDEYIIVFCTVNSKDIAKKIAHTIVKEKLCACVNLIKNIESIYTWDNKIQEDNETLMIIKTRKILFEQLKEKIIQLHPYEIPEIISTNICNGLKPYLDWVSSCTIDKK